MYCAKPNFPQIFLTLTRPKVTTSPLLSSCCRNLEFFPLNHYRVPLLKEIFFSPCRKVFDFRFCPVCITVTSGPSVLEWAWLSAKCCRALWEVVIWFPEWNSSSTFRKCSRFVFFILFNGDKWAAQRNTCCFCNFLFISFDAFCL